MTPFPRDALRSIVADLACVDCERVIWKGDPIPFLGPDEDGRTGMIVLDIVATRSLGVDDEKHEYNVVDPTDSVSKTRITYAGNRVRTVQVRAEQYDGERGYELLEEVRSGLEHDDTIALLVAANISVNSLEDVLNLGGTANNRTTTFASFDAKFNQKVSKVVWKASDADTYIEKVDSTGTGDLALGGEFEVDAPS